MTCEQNLPLPPELGRLSTLIDSNVGCIVESSSELRSITLSAAKHIFDWALEAEKSSKPHIETLLATLTEAAPPQTRSQARRTSKRRRSPSPAQRPRKKIDVRETPLPCLFIEGMNVDQIWQQLELRALRICGNLQMLLGGEEDETENPDEEGSDNNEDEDEDEGEGEGNDDEDNNDDEEDETEMDVGEDEGEEDGGSTAEGIVDLQDEDDEDDGSPSSILGVVRGHKSRPSGSHTLGHSDLDDGFFELTAFNAETSKFKAKEVCKSDSVAGDDSTEESEVDLFISIDDPSDENSPGLFYNDFFEPPRVQNRSIRSTKVRFHEQVTVKKIRAVGKGLPVSSMDDEDSDEEEDSSDDSSSSDNQTS